MLFNDLGKPDPTRLAEKTRSRVSLKQENRALHEFADTLHAHSQSESNFSISEALRPQQYTLALFRCELGKCLFEALHSLFQKDLLFGARRRVYPFRTAQG